jgi:hypothetical protein
VSGLKTYTVVGIYEDNHQRWAESYQADDAAHAEEQALDSAKSQDCELLIAAVIEGDVKVVR